MLVGKNVGAAKIKAASQVSVYINFLCMYIYNITANKKLHNPTYIQ